VFLGNVRHSGFQSVEAAARIIAELNVFLYVFQMSQMRYNTDISTLS
jgi:hypothetical protein